MPPTGSAPVRGPVRQEAIVVGVLPVAPVAVGVVTGLLRQQRRSVLGLEVDGPFLVGDGSPVIHTVHDTRVGLPGVRRNRHRTAAGRPPGTAPPQTLVASVIVSAPNGPPDDDAFWRRPDKEDLSSQDVGRSPAEPDPAPRYEGPPRAEPPPPGWRPPVLAQSPSPRSMPEQDEPALD